MAHQRPWNKYEVALLIECYINVTEKGCNPEDELNRLSIALRQMALNDGFEIDEVYRNLNGMHWQYGFMKAAFEGVRYDGKPSQLFFDMVARYKNDRAAFQEVLEEAHRLARKKEAEGMPSEEVSVSVKNGEIQSAEQSSSPAPVSVGFEERLSQFSGWLLRERQLAANTAVSYTGSLKSADAYALKHGILSESFITSADETLAKAVWLLLSDEAFSAYNSGQHNRFSAALNSYLVFRLGEERAFRQFPRKRKLREKHRESEPEAVCPEALRELLIKRFPYGIRPDSSIDILKLREFAKEFRVELTKDDTLLRAQIVAGGDAFEGKIYFIAEDTLEEMESLVQSIFNTGVCVIYYEKLFDDQFHWFGEHHISSPDHVRELLKDHMEGVFCSKNFIRIGSERISEIGAAEEEFKRVWGDRVTHTYSELYELLPYIPADKIPFYLSRSYYFVWSSSETFAWLDKFIISEEEIDEIWKYVDSMCETAGFASISEIPLGNTVEENYEISKSAIYDAIYRVVLSEHFQINGKILTRKDRDTNALTLAKAYCVDRDECTLSDLNDYVISITGTSGRQIAFRAAYDQMVRISKEKFVEDDAVRFDIDAIDALLDEFITGDFVSVRSIATFVLFPACGHVWNHFILESFCYRFSKKYRLEVINFNDKNAGIIVKKDCALPYREMLAIAAARSFIELTQENVGRFLCENGYTAKSKMTALEYVTARAQTLRRKEE